MGQLQLVTGLLSDDGTRVIGMPVPKESDMNNHDVVVSLQSGEVLQADSVARLPSQLSEDQAAVTYAHVLTHVHSVLSVVEGVGGSPSTTVATPPRHVVIVGGNVDAIHAAQALHTLGSDVTVVSTTSPKVQPLATTDNNNKATLTVTDPSMGNVGFAQALGTFDALLDTLGNEQGSLDTTSSSVVALLKERHGCATYISTCTHAQELMAKEGVLWGPGKVKHYHSQLLSSTTHGPATTTVRMVAPPPHIGATVQTLLQAGLVWTTQNSAKQRQSTPQVRSWDLARYMETTLWPSDNRGTATTRYGFPVPGTTSFDDNDDEEEEMILEPPLTAGRISTTTPDNDSSSRSGTTIVSKSPYIRRMDTVRELQRIEEEQLDCVLLLSAKFCRACKKMQLPYNTMARRRHNPEAKATQDNNHNHKNEKSLVFCQAEASGHAGKLVGRALGIDAVPTFVLYRQGQRYGDPLSITRLPSNQLEQALEALLDGSEPPAP